jgi:hypothetical protein
VARIEAVNQRFEQIEEAIKDLRQEIRAGRSGAAAG